MGANPDSIGKGADCSGHNFNQAVTDLQEKNEYVDYRLYLFNHYILSPRRFGPYDCHGNRYEGHPCGRLDCVTCGPFRCRRYATRIHDCITAHNLNTLVTLTTPRDFRYPGGYERLRTAWQKFKGAYSRKYGRPLTCIYVYGKSRTGLPHLHILTDIPLEMKWLRNKWHRLTGGQQIKQEAVGDQWKIASYFVRNYLEAFGYKGIRRIGASRNLGLRLSAASQREAIEIVSQMTSMDPAATAEGSSPDSSIARCERPASPHSSLPAARTDTGASATVSSAAHAGGAPSGLVPVREAV